MAARSQTTSRVVNRSTPYSLFFDANNDFVSMGNTFDKERTDSFSMSAWVWYTGVPLARGIMGKIANSGTFTGYNIDLLTTGVVRVNLINTITTNQIRITTNTALPIARWVNLTMTYSGSSSASGVKVYYNGVSQTMVTFLDNLTGSISNSNNFAISSFNAVNAFIFNGYITRCRIFNTALTQAEINSMYFSDITPSSVQGEWLFTDGSGPTVTATVGGVNGTITGAAWSTYTPFKPRNQATSRTQITTPRTQVT